MKSTFCYANTKLHWLCKLDSLEKSVNVPVIISAVVFITMFWFFLITQLKCD